MKQAGRKTSILVAITCSFLGFFLLVSIFLNVLGYNINSNILEAIVYPGKLLLSAFFLASFYIPLFICGCGFLCMIKPFKPRHLGLLVFSIVPFFTFSLLLKIVSIEKAEQDAVSMFLYHSLGVELAGIILSTLLVFEFYLIFRIVSRSAISAASVKKQRASSTTSHEDARQLDVMLESKPGESISGKRELILSMNRINRLLADNQHDAGKQKAGESYGLPTNGNQEKQSSKIIQKQTLSVSEAKVQTDKKEKVSTPAPFLENEDSQVLEELQDTSGELEGTGDAASYVKKVFDSKLGRARSESGELIDGIEDDALEDEEAELPQARPLKTKGASSYSVPVDGILNDYEDGTYWTVDEETRDAGEVLMETLREFNIQAEVTGIRKGPVITMFELLPAPGVKLSKITNLADNIALRLAASRVRIVAPIPGKHAVGIEVPNKKRAIVSFKELITLDLVRSEKYEIPIIIGKDIAGEAQIIDLVQTPHLLIAGATGSGKSVCVNSIICSILYTKSPDEVKLLLIDPKIVELKFYNGIPHLLAPVVTEPRRAFQALQYCLCEMERRYSLLDSLGVRDIGSYNRKAAKKKMTIPFIPYIVILIDEFADLIATTGKDMEATIARLAAMSRAVGIHVVLATQRPSVDVITGLIKANIPSRIAFMVASKFDSRIIIDSVGAEKLLGKGDMLLSAAWDPVPVRIQGAYLAEEEVEAVSNYVKTLGEPNYIDDDIFLDDEEEDRIEFGENDPLMDKALEIVVTKGKASASYLQRRLKIGYNRAARIVEEMEIRGIVGPANGSKPRDILHVPDRK